MAGWMAISTQNSEDEDRQGGYCFSDKLNCVGSFTNDHEPYILARNSIQV